MNQTQTVQTQGAYRVGDRVRVKEANPHGNLRTPTYVRGKVGTISLSHGLVENFTDHRGVYPWLYSVQFDSRELFGADSHHMLSVDIHEEWLDPA